MFVFNDKATAAIHTLSLHDALPISSGNDLPAIAGAVRAATGRKGAALYMPLRVARSEEHTSELQSQFHLVCRLSLEKKSSSNSVFSSWIWQTSAIVLAAQPPVL